MTCGQGVRCLPPARLFCLFFLQDVPAGRSLPEDHSLDTAQHARKGGANLHHMTWERGQPPPAAIDASALRARRRWRGRCAAGRLRWGFERVMRAHRAAARRAAAHLAGAAGGWRPSVEAGQRGGGGAWRRRSVGGHGGPHGGRTRAQRSQHRRRVSRVTNEGIWRERASCCHFVDGAVEDFIYRLLL